MPNPLRVHFCWEKLNRGVSKPGCFPLFSGKVQIVSRTLSGLFLVGALNRPRKRKRTNRENPRSVPEQIGKIPEKSGKSQKGQKKDKKGRTSPDRETPPFETPPFSGPWFCERFCRGSTNRKANFVGIFMALAWTLVWALLMSVAGPTFAFAGFVFPWYFNVIWVRELPWHSIASPDFHKYRKSRFSHHLGRFPMGPFLVTLQGPLVPISGY